MNSLSSPWKVGEVVYSELLTVQNFSFRLAVYPQGTPRRRFGEKKHEKNKTPKREQPEIREDFSWTRFVEQFCWNFLEGMESRNGSSLVVVTSEKAGRDGE